MGNTIGKVILFILGIQFVSIAFSIGLIPGFIVLMIFLSALDSQKKKKNTASSSTAKAKGFKGKKAAEFNKNVRLYFDTHQSLALTENISIQAEKTAGRAAYKLYVYYGNERVCLIDEFSKYYPKTYMDLLETAFEAVVPSEYDTLTAQSKQKVSAQAPREKKVLKKDSAEYYIESINGLITQITKSEITEDLHHTTAMLKQIKLIEEKYPQSKDKLVKLYQYYLPILEDILEGYVKLVSSNSVHDEIVSVELKLRKTIVLVNEALKTITMQLCEDEIIDMKSDMSVLEAILRKDGLVKDGTMFAEEKSVK